LAGAASAQYPFVTNIPGSFVDISTSGTLVITGDDNSAPVNVALGTPNVAFPNGTLNVCTNGHAGYGTAFTGFSNFAIPSTSFYNGGIGVAPFWDDLITGTATNSGVYSQMVGGVLVIQWNNMNLFSGGTEPGTFELQIFPDSSGPGGALC